MYMQYICESVGRYTEIMVYVSNWCKGVHKSTILCSVGGEGGMQKDSSSSKVIWWMVRCALPLEDVQSYD